WIKRVLSSALSELRESHSKGQGRLTGIVQVTGRTLAALKGQRDMSRTPTQSPIAPAQRPNRVIPSGPVQRADGRNPQEDKIRFRAYLLAEAAGFPPGRADEFWHQAEKEIRSGNSR